jgi:hypothetical protein
MVTCLECEDLDNRMVETVAYLNRMIRQHKDSPTLIVWIELKGFIEKEILKREIVREM